MGTINEKTVFETDDGKQFTNLQDAQAHDAMRDLAKQLEYEFDIRPDTSRAMATWVIERYDPKDPE